MFLTIDDNNYDLNNIEIDFNYNSNGYSYLALKRRLDNTKYFDNMKERLNSIASLYIEDGIFIFENCEIKDIHYKIYTENNICYEYIRIVI